MRKTLRFDDTKNVYIEKLEMLYYANPISFYIFIEILVQKPIFGMDFSNKTECVKLPEKEKIYPATIFHPYYEVFILSNQDILLNQESLKKHIELITGEKHFPQIILVASNKSNKAKVLSSLDGISPPKSDDINYNLAVVTDAEFNRIYTFQKEIAIKDALSKINRLAK